MENISCKLCNIEIAKCNCLTIHKTTGYALLTIAILLFIAILIVNTIVLPICEHPDTNNKLFDVFEHMTNW